MDKKKTKVVEVDSLHHQKKTNKIILIILVILLLILSGICYLSKDILFNYVNNVISVIYNNTNTTTADINTNANVLCKDISAKSDCMNYKQYGHCESSPAYMIQYCAHTCQVCHLVDPEVRCKKFYSNERVFKNNEMNDMFESLIKTYHQDCNDDNDKVCTNNDSTNPSPLTIISRDPWVLTIDNYITEEDADAIVRIPPQSAWSQSTAAGAYQADGLIKREVSETRTSRNAWCQVGCDEHPTVQNLLKRMSDTVKVPISNFEHMQILRYDPGQFYRGHHDFIHSPPAIEEAIGPRIITFFLYLSNVTNGGETYFNNLNITVTPSKGKALIWANTLSNNPNIKDIRTFHEAKDVIEGIKYGANIWIHQKDFRSANHWACSG